MNASRIYGQEQGYNAIELWQLASDDDVRGLEESAEAGHKTMRTTRPPYHAADVDARKGIRYWCRGTLGISQTSMLKKPQDEVQHLLYLRLRYYRECQP